MSENSKLFFVNLDIESKERYDLSKFLEYSDNFDPLNSTLLTEIQTLDSGGEYVVTSEEGRPDLVSNKLYGTVDYWQIVMLYNGIDDVDAIVIGKRIKFPSIASLENLFFGLKSRQSSSEA